MVALTHVIYAAAYIVAGGVAGAAFPILSVGASPLDGWIGGALIILSGGLIHEVIARVISVRRLRDHQVRLDQAALDLTGEIVNLRAELTALSDQVDEARRTGGLVDYDRVMNEVRLLQSLVSRLYDKKTSNKTAPMVVKPATGRKVPESGAAVIVGDIRSDAEVIETVRDALNADRIDIYLQPIVSLPQRKHRFYEVFSRVRAADGSQIMPERYIEVAAKEGLIATIDNLLLVRCIQLIRETERRQHSIGFFSNISAATINDGDFMRQFLQFMAQNRPLVSKLVFEFSQDDIKNADKTTLTLLEQLAKLGFHFSMDQVSDLDIDIESLARAEVRYIKLDHALIGDPAMRPRALALRRAVENRPIDLIVEKIETEAQLVEILDFGLDFGQGYLFGEPRLSRKPV